uniref:KOW domain-containing protein n=1 Tax=Cucumis melo TaxID=3656 RepID=A0A9I9DI70_CUCME
MNNLGFNTTISIIKFKLAAAGDLLSSAPWNIPFRQHGLTILFVLDVVSIPKTSENFRLLYDTKGRFRLHSIRDEEAKFKLCKVRSVQFGQKGIPYLNTYDGRTIRYPDPLIKANDTIKLDLESNKIADFIKFDVGNVVMVTGGRNRGRVGVIKNREKHKGSFETIHIQDATGHEFATRLGNVFTIGKGTKPWVSLPKGKGLTILFVLDVVSIPKTSENFRLLYDTKGRFRLHSIRDEEAKFKLCKVRSVQFGQKGIPYLNTYDGRTIRYPDPLIKANDTIKLDLESNKIADFIKFDVGNVVMVTGGRNRGRVGVIKNREKHKGSFETIHIQDATGHEFATRLGNVFTIGKGTKPWVSLPKGKGIKLTIIEEARKRLASQAAVTA